MDRVIGSILSYIKLLVNIISHSVVEYSREVRIVKPLKEKISITIDSDLLEKLRKIADEDCRPLSQYINLVLRDHIRELKNGK